MTNNETIKAIRELPDSHSMQYGGNGGDDAGFLTDDLKALVARLERAEAVIADAMGQGTWDAAFVKLAEYREGE